jgi:hypothetical protein
MEPSIYSPMAPDVRQRMTLVLAVPLTRDSRPGQVALMRAVSRDCLPTIGARLREGRFFDISDQRAESPLAIVNESFANRHFPGRSAIGARFKYGQLNERGYWYTIVGVVKEIREVGMEEELRPAVYRLLEHAEQVEANRRHRGSHVGRARVDRGGDSTGDLLRR